MLTDQWTLGESLTGWEDGLSPRWDARRQLRAAAVPSKTLESNFFTSLLSQLTIFCRILFFLIGGMTVMVEAWVLWELAGSPPKTPSSFSFTAMPRFFFSQSADVGNSKVHSASIATPRVEIDNNGDFSEPRCVAQNCCLQDFPEFWLLHTHHGL